MCEKPEGYLKRQKLVLLKLAYKINEELSRKAHRRCAAMILELRGYIIGRNLDAVTCRKKHRSGFHSLSSDGD